jgi:hypothetical protein
MGEGRGEGKETAEGYVFSLGFGFGWFLVEVQGEDGEEEEWWSGKHECGWKRLKSRLRDEY